MKWLTGCIGHTRGMEASRPLTAISYHCSKVKKYIAYAFRLREGPRALHWEGDPNGARSSFAYRTFENPPQHLPHPWHRHSAIIPKHMLAVKQNQDVRGPLSPDFGYAARRSGNIRDREPSGHIDPRGVLREGGVSAGPLEPAEAERVADSFGEANTHALCTDRIVLLAQFIRDNSAHASDSKP